MNVQEDHVHVLAMVPPKVSISDYLGTIKGRTAIRIFNLMTAKLTVYRERKMIATEL